MSQNQRQNRNIAIDGPAGAGKSTIAKRVAEEKHLIYVDTGAMYRAMGIWFRRAGLDPGDEEGISRAAAGAEVSLRYQDGEQQVFLNGENVTPLLRTEEAGEMASACSVYPAVRDRMVALQRDLAARTAVVMDGRDIGTVVLPDACLKVYLTAGVRERARRRTLELEQRGVACDPAAVEADIRERDERDMNRSVSPLRQAEDAVLLDSSDLSIGEVVERVLSLYERALGESQGGGPRIWK